jgi:HEAT repeat protein
LHDDDRLLGRLAADALAALGSEGLPVLLEALKVGPQAARVEAMRALALMKEMDAVPALFGGLDDESALIEYWADEGLQRRGIGMVFYK